MAQGICSVDNCDTYGRLARGFCLTHYARWLKYGNTDEHPPPTIEQRWWAKVDKSGPIPELRPDLGPCWVWTGWISKDGYGRFATELPRLDGSTKRRRKKHLAHRWGYSHFVAPVAAHLEVDHLCFNRACVNFERHLDPVTKAENLRRGQTIGAINLRKTHCDYGHEFTPENTKITNKGHRACRKCERRREAARERDWTRGPNRGKPIR